MSQSSLPTLAVTMGDPAGIGPEIIVGAWRDEHIHSLVRLVVVGHAEVLRRAARLLHHDTNVIPLDAVQQLESAVGGPKSIPCLAATDDEALDVAPGRVDARAGRAAYDAVRTAARLAIDREVDGMVTAPLSKAALHAAGYCYPGHTELLAEICGVADYAMMLYLPACPAVRSPHGLGVVHVTLHQPLRSVFADVSTAAIVAKCRLAHEAMRRLGVPSPRLAVCALNPHAGEDGLFGDEEASIIAPAVKAAQRAALQVSGPYPADTLMLRARDGEFDAVVAMYHDQGHIALKLLGMHAAVNITLGLPVVRTSVAHGTAFDRAWQGTARPDGMIAAIRAAATLATSQQHHPQ